MTIIVNNIQEITAGLTNADSWSNALPVMLWDSTVKGLLLAQEVSDPDILGQIKSGWDNFVETGQIWALIIGMILGYLFRGFRGS